MSTRAVADLLIGACLFYFSLTAILWLTKILCEESVKLVAHNNWGNPRWTRDNCGTGAPGEVFPEASVDDRRRERKRSGAIFASAYEQEAGAQEREADRFPSTWMAECASCV